MRANKIMNYTSVLQVLGESGCPFCRFLKDFQAAALAHRRVHKDKPLRLSHDSSMMLSVVDTEEKLQSFLPIVDQMVSEGLVVLSGVDIAEYAHRAAELKENQG